MGYKSWSSDAYDTIKNNYASKTTSQIFTSTKTTKNLDPVGVDFRESRDSANHPETLAVMVFVDVTGSMGMIPEDLIRNKLGVLMETLIKNGIEHPQILFGAIGDHRSDKAPLQVGQFESDAELLNKWLSEIYLEGGGGAQAKESYLLAYLFGARHTSIDCYEKRGVKGFLFTIGDEATWEKVDTYSLKRIMGYKEDTSEVTVKELLEEVQRTYHVFHLHVQEGSYRNNTSILSDWRELLPESLLIVEDYTTIAEIISSTVAVVNGADLASVVSDFDTNTAGLVTNALAKLTSSVSKSNAGVTEL